MYKETEDLSPPNYGKFFTFHASDNLYLKKRSLTLYEVDSTRFVPTKFLNLQAPHLKEGWKALVLLLLTEGGKGQLSMLEKKVTFVMHMGCDTLMSTPTLKIANRENRNQQPNILKTPT